MYCGGEEVEILEGMQFIINHYSDIEVNDFINLTRLCITHTTFEFNSKF